MGSTFDKTGISAKHFGQKSKQTSDKNLVCVEKLSI